MDDKNNKYDISELKTEGVGKLLWKYSLPAIVGMLVFSCYNLIDRIFIGRATGSLGIAAISVTYPIFLILMALGMLVGIGSGTLISIKLGAGCKDDAEKILGNAFCILLAFSAIATGAGILYLDDILISFGASPNTLSYAHDFMLVIFLGTVFSFISMGLNNVIRAEGNPGIAMGTMIIGSHLR